MSGGNGDRAEVKGPIERDGFAVVGGVVDAGVVEELIEAVTGGGSVVGVREKGGARYAVRNLCGLVPRVAEVARSAGVRELVEPVVGRGARVVRSLLFDKNPAANWKVPWHQDLSIAVKERREVAGFGPWSSKAGVVHVQPPVGVLEGMVTVRIHLDECGEENGPLRVVPGSHRLGVIGAEEIAAAREGTAEVTCAVAAGGAVLMRPLLLHASSPAVVAGHRRVVHLEFAAGELPGGIEWAEA